MTVIDDILEGLRLQSTVFSRLTFSGDWGYAKDSLAGAPFHLVRSGPAWLRANEDDAMSLDPGDIVILPHGDAHHLLSRPQAHATPWEEIVESMGWTHWEPGTHFKAVDLHLGSGSPTTTLITGVFSFGDARRNPLLDALPSVLLLRAASESVAARAVVSIAALLDAELLSGMPGAEAVSARLADILFIQVVRHQLASADELPSGWLRAMADREIAPALAIMHRAPEQSWSVAALARELGMSRSRFAARFHEVVGQTPLNYLTQWRMYQAAGQLAEGRMGLAEVAASVGYLSEASFSKAFKRWIGQSPARYRRDRSKSD